LKNSTSSHVVQYSQQIERREFQDRGKFAFLSSFTHPLTLVLLLPVAGFVVSEWCAWRKEQVRPRYGLIAMPPNASLPPYPLDMKSLLVLPLGVLDDQGVPYNRATSKYPATHHPTTIAEYGLAHWNRYLATGDNSSRDAFLVQAHWLVKHEIRLAEHTGGWPIPFTAPDYLAKAPWLSALTQGNVISVLVRAYLLTHDVSYLEVAHRAVRTFERDIMDCGVRSSMQDGEFFFEEVAVYPSAHILNGYLFGIFGLYDYINVTNDSRIATLLQKSLFILDNLLDEFDTGYWSRYELHFQHLAPRFYHALHVIMLNALADYSGNQHYSKVATRWDNYQRSIVCSLQYFIASRLARYERIMRRLFLRKHPMGKNRVYAAQLAHITK
jgi:hypothetical protein